MMRLRYPFLLLLALTCAVASVINYTDWLVVSGIGGTSLPSKGLLALYTFQRGASGTVLYDVSGNRRNCTINGTEAGSTAYVSNVWSSATTYAFRGLLGLTLYRTTGTYIGCPSGITSGLSNMTSVIVTRLNNDGTTNQQWARQFDINADTNHFSEFSLIGGNSKPQWCVTTAGVGGWKCVENPNASTGAWERYTLVWTGGSKIEMYLNGALIATTTGVAISPSSITSTNYYLGKSVFGTDPYLQGDYAIHAVYGTAWSASQVKVADNHIANVMSRRTNFDVPTTWVRNSASAIIGSQGSVGNDCNYVYAPEPKLIGGTIELYVGCWSNGRSTGSNTGKIYRWEGSSLTSLSKIGAALAPTGTGNGWPELTVTDPTVFDNRAVDSTCYMYFFGSNTTGFEVPGSEIGAATSTDCKTSWTHAGKIVSLTGSLSGVTNLWGFFAVGPDAGGLYHGFFNAGPVPGNERIHHITSTSPLFTSWVYVGVAVDVGTTGKFDSGKITEPRIFTLNRTVGPTSTAIPTDTHYAYAMVYGTCGAALCSGDYDNGIAYSNDLTTWVKGSSPGRVPIAMFPGMWMLRPILINGSWKVVGSGLGFGDGGSIYLGDPQ